MKTDIQHNQRFDARILVIHNNDEIVSHNTINLVSLGYRVHSVDDVNMGLKLLAADPESWSIIVLKQTRDSHTHTLNVINAMNETAPHAKVVLVTDVTHKFTENMFTGVSAIVEWPYDARQLAQTINEVLNTNCKAG